MSGSSAWFDKDFYAVLGVAEDVSAAEIKRAYKKLASLSHPDRNPGDRGAEERMKAISEAYAVLKDPDKRSEYDQVRRMARGGTQRGGVRVGGAPFDLGDIFGSFFGSRQRPARGADLEARATLTFDEAFHGATIPVRVTRDASCRVCGGSGDTSGRVRVCPTCGGSGMTAESQGVFSFGRACPACGGSGRTVEDPCRTCDGTGAERVTETVKVKVPAGINDGARIRVRGRGGAAPGAPSGNLYVVVQVEPHAVFGRRGRDLTLTMPVSYPAAALGASVRVPTMNGPVTLKVPPGTQPGRTFRVRGKGVPAARGTGDLLVTVQIDVPERVTDQERALLEQLAQLHQPAGGTDG